MPPKKKVERPAQENISLGPQVREGQFHCFALGREISPLPSLHRARQHLPPHARRLTDNRRARFWDSEDLRLLQRYIRSRYRSLVSAEQKVQRIGLTKR
jgi:hypothetical protein